MTLSPSFIQQIRASLTMIWGWFDQEQLRAWSHIFPLTSESQDLGFLPLTNLTWLEWENPRWRFPTDSPSVVEGKIIGWRALSLTSPDRLLPESSILPESKLRELSWNLLNQVSNWFQISRDLHLLSSNHEYHLLELQRGFKPLFLIYRG